MQFLLIARMFGFSKSSSKHSDSKRKKIKKSRRHKTSKSCSKTYIKREHIKSESGLCAMDEKTLKLLTDMETIGETNGQTHIVNDHICQVSNTFTKNGRYTQIICTTFTPYDKTKYTKPHSHHMHNINHINIESPNNNIISDEVDITPPLPTTHTSTETHNINIQNTQSNEMKHKDSNYSDYDYDNDHMRKDSHYSDQPSFKLDFEHKLHDETDDIVLATNININNINEPNSTSNNSFIDSKSLSNLVRIDCTVTNITAAIETELGRNVTNINDKSTSTSTSSSSSSSTDFNQYDEDKKNGLILKDFVEGMKNERRPSNLFRKNSQGRWKLDDLEDQENSIKKQMLMISKSKSNSKNKFDIGLNPDTLSPLEQDYDYT